MLNKTWHILCESWLVALIPLKIVFMKYNSINQQISLQQYYKWKIKKIICTFGIVKIFKKNDIEYNWSN